MSSPSCRQFRTATYVAWALASILLIGCNEATRGAITATPASSSASAQASPGDAKTTATQNAAASPGVSLIYDGRNEPAGSAADAARYGYRLRVVGVNIANLPFGNVPPGTPQGIVTLPPGIRSFAHEGQTIVIHVPSAAAEGAYPIRMQFPDGREASAVIRHATDLARVVVEVSGVPSALSATPSAAGTTIPTPRPQQATQPTAVAPTPSPQPPRPQQTARPSQTAAPSPDAVRSATPFVFNAANRWDSSAIPVPLCYRHDGAPSSLSEADMVEIVNEAMSEWQDPGSSFRFTYSGLCAGPRARGDGVNSISWGLVQQGATGVTDVVGDCPCAPPPPRPLIPITEADLVLSPLPRGDGSAAAKRASVEITLRHELGHVLGLGHVPNVPPHLMSFTGVGHVGDDERAGLRELYPR